MTGLQVGLVFAQVRAHDKTPTAPGMQGAFCKHAGVLVGFMFLQLGQTTNECHGLHPPPPSEVLFRVAPSDSGPEWMELEEAIAYANTYQSARLLLADGTYA